VDRRELLVLCVVGGIGLVFGMLLFRILPQRASIIALGVFVTLVGIQGLVRPQLLFAVPKPIAWVMLLLGGAVHGAFTVGGPLIIVYCRRAIRDKTTFRSTLTVVWIVLNFALMGGWTLTSAWRPGTLQLTLIGLPFSLAALIVGEWIHHRVDAKSFGVWVNVVLILSGTLLAVSAVRA
jgi:uncharacterized membrane protein YfcA